MYYTSSGYFSLMCYSFQRLQEFKFDYTKKYSQLILNFFGVVYKLYLYQKVSGLSFLCFVHTRMWPSSYPRKEETEFREDSTYSWRFERYLWNVPMASWHIPSTIWKGLDIPKTYLWRNHNWTVLDSDCSPLLLQWVRLCLISLKKAYTSSPVFEKKNIKR